ncbi:MAG: DUF3696 domain-containing protein [Flavobacteriales bacterium]|nr:DUF3696 domain-containing protein [Flavobacteriales bacterium]MCB9193506.1 DUF3696 domain-containing protein [Flavobacteriales bacterium]
MDKHLDHFEVRWKNFKGFKDTGWVKIKPITIVLGPNNSGKTNFLAPFLLLHQTVNSRDFNSPLILKGSSYDAGNYQEIARNYITENPIQFGYFYHLHESDEELDPVGMDAPGGFEVTFGVDSKLGDVQLRKTTIYDVYRRKYLSLKQLNSGKYSYQGINSQSMTNYEKMSIRQSQPVNFLFSPNIVLPSLERISSKSREDDEMKRESKQFSEGFSDFLSAISYNNSQVRRYLGGVSFIGPLRDTPKRIYEFTNETYNTVGNKGENTPNILNRIGNDNEELNTWVRRFGFGDKLEVIKHYSNSCSIRFINEMTGYYTTMVNAGFGASQVLPLIVQAIVSPQRSITLAEQPEIHLNPRVQCELADLFVYMAKKRQTIIAETHSEHLLLRLRRLIAQEEIDVDKVAIYFVDMEDGESKIKEIKLYEDGSIRQIDWPEGFFGDTLKEALALASVQAIRNNR